jgi:hypothetical protein
VTEFYLQLRYGSDVQLEYVDLTSAESRARFPEVVRVAEGRGLPYPLVAIDGQVKVAGSADFYHVLPLVEQALEAEGVAD